MSATACALTSADCRHDGVDAPVEQCRGALGCGGEVRSGQVELLGREVVHRGADRSEVEHTQAHPGAVLGCPLVAPPSEAGPPRGAQDPRPHRTDAVVVGHAALVQHECQQSGRVVGKRRDPCAGIASDDRSESPVGTRGSPPGPVEAQLAVRHLPRRVGLVDERSAPAGHDLVERIRGRSTPPAAQAAPRPARGADPTERCRPGPS